MDDRALMEDLLLLVKGNCGLYLDGAIESSTKTVHKAFGEVLRDTLSIQNEIYGKMANKGWYPAESALQRQIDKVANQFDPKKEQKSKK